MMRPLMRVLAIAATAMRVMMMVMILQESNLRQPHFPPFIPIPFILRLPYSLLSSSSAVRTSIRVFLTLLCNKHERFLQVDHRCIDSVCFQTGWLGWGRRGGEGRGGGARGRGGRRGSGEEGDKGKESEEKGREEGTHIYLYAYINIDMSVSTSTYLSSYLGS